MAITTDHCINLSTDADKNERFFQLKENAYQTVQKINERLKSSDTFSSIRLETAGFKYIGEDDKIRCEQCNLEVSGWTQDMKLFSIHTERSPNCPFVRSRLSNSITDTSEHENSTKRQKIESNSSQSDYKCKFIETKSLVDVRRRTFSHWSRHKKPSPEQMINAGFFSCNVDDRVICLYCNLICQKWDGDTDDPSEIHKVLSAKCLYVLSVLTNPEPSPVVILNETSTNSLNNQTSESNNTNPLQFNEIVASKPCHPAYSDITKRQQSFNTWSHQSSPSVEDFIRAGFFYTGANSVVTCFYCNGSLQNWSSSDNPMIEHARWFSHCSYAKQLCGDDLYRKIQYAKQRRHEQNAINQSNTSIENRSSSDSYRQQLSTNDPNMLSRYVAARLDLSMSQKLLDQGFKLSVIKRCWEDQLQLKKDDFATDCDLYIACTILQKQIDYIRGNKDNIIIPSAQMKRIRERNQLNLSSSQSVSDGDTTITSQTQSNSMKTKAMETEKGNSKTSEKNPEKNTPVSNPCLICLQDEKRLACIPCGHLAACVPCAHSMRTCPICRKEIEAFVRIYL